MLSKLAYHYGKKVKLPDVLIAATALHTDATLVKPRFCLLKRLLDDFQSNKKSLMHQGFRHFHE